MYVHVCMYMYVHVCTCMYDGDYYLLFMCAHEYVCMCMCYVCTCVYVCVYGCMYVCVYMCVCMSVSQHLYLHLSTGECIKLLLKVFILLLGGKRDLKSQSVTSR